MFSRAVEERNFGRLEKWASRSIIKIKQCGGTMGLKKKTPLCTEGKKQKKRRKTRPGPYNGAESRKGAGNRTNSFASRVRLDNTEMVSAHANG